MRSLTPRGHRRSVARIWVTCARGSNVARQGAQALSVESDSGRQSSRREALPYRCVPSAAEV
jgi:hypothetical protein